MQTYYEILVPDMRFVFTEPFYNKSTIGNRTNYIRKYLKFQSASCIFIRNLLIEQSCNFNAVALYKFLWTYRCDWLKLFTINSLVAEPQLHLPSSWRLILWMPSDADENFRNVSVQPVSCKDFRLWMIFCNEIYFAVNMVSNIYLGLIYNTLVSIVHINKVTAT